MSAFKIYSIYSFFLKITYFTTYCTAKLSGGQEVCNTLCSKRAQGFLPNNSSCTLYEPIQE